MTTRSILRITFDPTGTPWIVLDWGQVCGDIDLPWQQEVESPAFPGANAKDVIARGNVSREITIMRREDFSGSSVPAEAMQAAIFAADATRPVGLTKALRVRVLDLSAATTGDEAARTLASYTATQAALRSARPRINKAAHAIDWTYVFSVNAFTLDT